MDTSGSIILKDVVNRILFRTGKDSGDYVYVYEEVISAIREINMLYSTQFKVTKIGVDINTKTIPVPSDYLGLVYLGFPEGGRIHILTKDDELVTTTTMINGQETLTTSQGEGVPIGHGQTRGYGATGGKNKYYYTYDAINGRFFINGTNLQFANIVLAYRSSGVSDENTVIPIKLYPSIEYCVRMRMEERLEGDLRKAQYFDKRYEEEINKLKSFEAPTIDEIYDSFYKATSGTYQR